MQQIFENHINFPEQRRVACRVPKSFIWGCLKRDWKGVEAFHLKFNKAAARVGTADPPCALQAFHSTPTIYWSLSTGFAFPRHTGGITERAKGKELGIVLETLPEPTPVSFPGCPPHEVMAAACSWRPRPQPALRLGRALLACPRPQECFVPAGTSLLPSTCSRLAPLASGPERDREAPTYFFPDVIWRSTAMTELTKASL